MKALRHSHVKRGKDIDTRAAKPRGSYKPDTKPRKTRAKETEPRKEYKPETKPRKEYKPRGREGKCDPYEEDTKNFPRVEKMAKENDLSFEWTETIEFFRNEFGFLNILFILLQPKNSVWKDKCLGSDTFYYAQNAIQDFYGRQPGGFECVRSGTCLDLVTIPGRAEKDIALLTPDKFPALAKVLIDGMKRQGDTAEKLIRSGEFDAVAVLPGHLGGWAQIKWEDRILQARDIGRFEYRRTFFDVLSSICQVTHECEIPLLRRLGKAKVEFIKNGFTHPAMKRSFNFQQVHPTQQPDAPTSPYQAEFKKFANKTLRRNVRVGQVYKPY